MPIRMLTQNLARGLGKRLRHVQVRGIPRLFYTSAPWVLGPGRRVIRSVSGAWIDIDPSEYASCMMFFGRYAAELLAVAKALVSPGDSVVDIGAQLGYVTSQLATMVGPKGVVHSFEPDPNAAARLRTAVERNGLSWVKIFELAASSRAGELTFGISETLGWSTAVVNCHLTNLHTATVQSVRVDDLLAEGEIRKPVRFVKLDIEGFECEALEGMRDLLSEERPFVVTEIAPDLLRAAGKSSRDVLESIKRHDYRFYEIKKRPGILSAGAADLHPIETSATLGFCDVLCVPAGVNLPPTNTIRVVG